MINGQRDGHPFRNVVNGHRHGNRNAEGGIFHRRHKRGKPLREIVNGERKRGKKPQMF